MREAAVKLIDAARVVRSKNAGPATLTIDLLFPDRAAYDRALAAPALAPAAIARLYARPAGAVRVIPYPAALAVKVVLDRTIVAGSPGDVDVYGAQQHGPLLEVEI
jgi:hypothetical protein